MKNTIFYDIAQSNFAYKQYMESDDTLDLKKHIANALNTAILEELTDTQRKYFLKYFMDGWSIQSISELYGVCPSTVSRVLKSAKKNIAKAMRYSSPFLLNKSMENRNRRKKNVRRTEE